jgi:Tfp pilus assembly protein PilV
MKLPANQKSRSGYVLFEVVLALMIFALSVLKLAESLQLSLEVAETMSNQNKVRIGLRSFVEEMRRKQVSEMATQVTDDALGVTYTSSVDPLTIKNLDGTVLTDLYVLHAKAEWGEGEAAHDESVDLYLYEPSGQNINNPTGTTAGNSAAAGTSTSSSSTGSK